MVLRRLIALVLAAALGGQEVKFEASTQLVVVNVTVRGKDGKPVPGLGKTDFRVLEDGKPMDLSVFEYQALKGEVLPMIAVPKPAPLEAVTDPPPKPDFSNKRLLILYFDFSSLPQTDQIRAKDAAVQFVSKQMTASDLVAIYTFSTRLKKAVDFTADRDLLLRTVQSFGVASGVEMDPAAAEVAEGLEEEDTTVADETEFAIFNTDQKLGALEDLSKELAPIPEKKAVIYFSSGVGRNGMDNQSQMQSAVNAAVRSGVSFYPIDVRGLIAMAPAGDASQAAPRGTGVFSGTQQARTRDRTANQQETLFALAADTGGKALLDSNDLAMGIRQAQRDVESYYTLAYYSSNVTKDGRFRKIKVEVAARKDDKLEYRPGYYADKVWKQFDSSDREKQLSEAMGLGNPATELPLAVELLYFRMEKNRYFVPVAIKIPGSKVLVKSGKTELDFLGTVKDARGRTMASLRDTIKVKLPDGASEKLTQKSLLYDAAFQLSPGEFTIKVLARENTEGKLGTFEAKFSIPDLDQPGVAPVSSLLLGTGREPVAAAIGDAGQGRKQMAQNPLITNGRKLTPSVTHVFRRPQTMTVYGETYTENATARLSLYAGKQRIWESANLKPAAGRAGAYSLEATVPLKGLKPGDYVCQLTVVDPAAQRYEVRRAALSIVP